MLTGGYAGTSVVPSTVEHGRRTRSQLCQEHKLGNQVDLGLKTINFDTKLVYPLEN